MSIGCDNSKQNEIISKERVVKSLQEKIDSMTLETDPVHAEPLIDSLLAIDPANKIALKTKANNYFNESKFSEAISVINQLKKQKDSLEPYLHVINGWSYERLDSNELSEKELSTALFKLSETDDQIWLRPALITIIFGKDSAEMWLANSGAELTDLSLYQAKNTLKNYRKGGLSEFYPKFFDYPHGNEFTVDISGLNYNFNSADAVELYFAKKGMNVYFKGTDKANERIFIVTTDYFAEELERLDPQTIKRR